MRALGLIDRLLASVVTALLLVAFALMLTLSAAQIVLREGFHSSIPWGDVAARHLVLVVGFLGACLAARAARHFRIEALARFLPAQGRRWVRVGTDLFAAAVCAVLVQAGRTFVLVAIDPSSVLFLGISQAAAAWVVPVGFVLVGIPFLLDAVRGIIGGEAA